MFYRDSCANVKKKIDSNIIKIFDDIFVYNFFFVKMSKEYYFKFAIVYKKNKKKFKILKFLNIERERFKDNKSKKYIKIFNT